MFKGQKVLLIYQETRGTPGSTVVQEAHLGVKLEALMSGMHEISGPAEVRSKVLLRRCAVSYQPCASMIPIFGSAYWRLQLS